MLRYYTGKIPRPAEMAEDQYTRTLRARAFDNSRYLLPLATNTSLGQIVNARTLETQIARLLSSPYAEVRHLGALLKDAAREPSYNVQAESMRALVEEIKAANPDLGAKRRATTSASDARGPHAGEVCQTPTHMKARREPSWSMPLPN